MDEITRYAMGIGEDGDTAMIPCSYGNYVWADDHLSAMQTKDVEIDRLTQALADEISMLHGERERYKNALAKRDADFAALEARNKRLAAPVSPSEANHLWCGDPHVIDFANKIIAARGAHGGTDECKGSEVQGE